MKDKDLFHHHTFYFVELVILLIGFFLMVLFSYDLTLQFIILTSVLIFYVVMGFLHHKQNHYFNAKIMIEYVLISGIILAAFLFLNISRI
jgi:Na+/H+ antiporter NhaC